ncbi:MAG: O-antigen ligase family protein [Candidatus Sumerlaeia bacterium]|nr:O-antigen ligase family protein [Candidatus Sumerlaeia bacterium]
MTADVAARTDPAGQLSWPRLALLLTLGLVVLSHLYPQAAYPTRGLPIGFGLLVAFVLAVVGCWRLGGGLPLRPAGAVALLGGVAWMLWWGVRQGSATVAALGRPAVATIFQGGLAFLTVALAVGVWRLERENAPSGDDAPPGDDAPESLAPLVGGVLVAMAALFAVHGIYQVLGPEGWPGTHATLAARVVADGRGLSDPLREGILHALREGRASGRLGSPNVFAGLLALGFPLALGLAGASASRIGRVACFAAAGILGAGVVLSGSRGGLLALAGGGGMVLVLGLGGRVLQSRAVKHLCLIGFVLLAGVALADGGLADRWLGGSTVRQRVLYWQAGAAIWQQNPLWGSGPGAFEVHYPQFRQPGAQETVFAHNWAVQWACDVGAAGLVLFGLWASASLALGLGWWRRAEGLGRQWLAAGFAAAGVAVLAHGLVEFTLQFRELYLDAAVVLGVLTGQGLAGVRGPAFRPGGRSLALPAVLLLVVGVTGWSQNEVGPALASMPREEAEWHLEEGDAAGAVESYTRALRWQPDDPRLLEARAFARHLAGDPNARHDLQRALALHANSARLHESFARFEAVAGNLPAALDWQRKAIALHPLDGDHRLMLAELLVRAGRPAEAAEAIASTDDLLLTPLERARRQRLLDELATDP